MNQVYSKEVCDLFTKGNHPRNISILLLTQNIFRQDPNCGDFSLNANYLVLLQNVRDKNQSLYLARQAYPKDSQSLYDSYRYATTKPHGYFILDFSQDTDDKLRFRTNVFPDEYPVAVYAPINIETHKIELS